MNGAATESCVASDIWNVEIFALHPSATAVCVKCIYDEHNGHSLIPVADMSNSLKQNVIDLRKMIDNTKRLIDENAVLVR